MTTLTKRGDPSLAECLEQIIVAGVALTTVAIAAARPGLDLTFPQWRVLVILGKSPTGVRISDVARRVGVTLPATSRQVKRLESRRLVTVATDELDRRASLARLTPEGREAHDAITAWRLRRLEELTAPFALDDALRGEVSRLADAISEVRGPEMVAT